MLIELWVRNRQRTEQCQPVTKRPNAPLNRMSAPPSAGGVRTMARAGNNTRLTIQGIWMGTQCARTFWRASVLTAMSRVTWRAAANCWPSRNATGVLKRRQQSAMRTVLRPSRSAPRGVPSARNRW